MILHDEITKEIESEVSRISASLPTVEWYLLGSFVANHPASSDIDILVVHPATVDARTVRAETRALCAQLPIHLLIMNEDEQRQLDFITSQRCVRIVTT